MDQDNSIDQYSRHKARMAANQAANSRAGRDIGPIPPVANPKRRQRCEKDLRLALKTYFPMAFTLEFSPDHLEFIKEIEKSLKEGTLKGQAMPRGSGKTTLIVRASILALLYGWRRLAVIVGATDQKAQENLDEIRTELESNDLLLEDFPEVCYPIRKLERINQRAKGQTCLGEPTRVQLLGDSIIFPAVKVPKNWGKPSCKYDWTDKTKLVPSPAYGHAIVSAGITGGRIRGIKHTLPTGEIIRPDQVLIDDPQTRKSAASPSEIRTRERIIQGDILGMAGPGQSISALAAITVIHRGDLADRLLDRNINPRWRGERCRLVKAMPAESAMPLWEEYNNRKYRELQAGGDGSGAKEFYVANLEAMQVGAVVGWKDRKLETDVDALQSAMDIYFDNREAFFAEYQNEPLDDTPDGDELLTPQEIASKLSHVDQGVIPATTQYLTAHIDIHDRVLYWAVMAWSPDYQGYVVDYGTFPKQPKQYFNLKDSPQSLGNVYPNLPKETAIEKGLDQLINDLLERDYRHETGGETQIDLCLIDEGYVTEIVRRVCRRSTHRSRLRPTKGVAVKPWANPMNEWKARDGEKAGDNWRQSLRTGIRGVIFETNHWKSFFHKRLSAAEGDPCNLTLFGRDPKRHELISDHCCAEYRVNVEGKGRRADEWRSRPGRPDNHHFDNLIGCTVAASILGAKLPEGTTTTKTDKPKRKKPKGPRGISYG